MVYDGIRKMGHHGRAGLGNLSNVNSKKLALTVKQPIFSAVWRGDMAG